MLYPRNSSVAPCKRATAKAKLLILEAICHEVGGGVDLLLAEDKNRGKKLQQFVFKDKGQEWGHWSFTIKFCLQVCF